MPPCLALSIKGWFGSPLCHVQGVYLYIKLPQTKETEDRLILVCGPP